MDVDELFDAWERAWSGRDPTGFEPLCADGFAYEDPLTPEPLRGVLPLVAHARKLWRALGFANVEDTDVAFTAADAEALGRAAGLVRNGVIDEQTAITWARALGQTTDRLVSWQIEALL